MPIGTYGKLEVRSKYSKNFSINGGVIDEGYTDEIFVNIRNDGATAFVLGRSEEMPFELIQIVFIPLTTKTDTLGLDPIEISLPHYKFIQKKKTETRHRQPHRSCELLTRDDLDIIGKTYIYTRCVTTGHLCNTSSNDKLQFCILASDVIVREYGTKEYTVPITRKMKAASCPHKDRPRSCIFCDANFYIYAMKESPQLRSIPAIKEFIDALTTYFDEKDWRRIDNLSIKTTFPDDYIRGKLWWNDNGKRTLKMSLLQKPAAKQLDSRVRKLPTTPPLAEQEPGVCESILRRPDDSEWSANLNRRMLERSHEMLMARGERAREMNRRSGRESPDDYASTIEY